MSEMREPVALEDVAVAFQKAMARAAQTTARAVADTPAMRYGTRQVYAVRRLEVELCVGAKVERLELNGGATERVSVTFDPPAERASRLRFSIDGAPVAEALREAGLFLLTPRLSRDGEALSPGAAARAGDVLEVWAAVHGAEGGPLPAAPVVLEIMRLAEGSAGFEPGGGRWVEAAPGRRWLRPRLTDGEGVARFRVPLPAGGPLIRVRARALLPGHAAAPSVLTERKALFLAVEPSTAPEDDAWRELFLSPEEAMDLPAGLTGAPTEAGHE